MGENSSYFYMLRQNCSSLQLTYLAWVVPHPSVKDFAKQLLFTNKQNNDALSIVVLADLEI